jgi:hypothetical protein
MTIASAILAPDAERLESMPDYASIALKVNDGLARAGSTMTLRRTAKGTYDAAAGTFGTDTVTDYSVSGLILSLGKPTSGSGQRFFNDVLVQTDDRLVAIGSSGLAISPRPGDQVVIDSVVWNVMSQVVINPGAVNLMFKLLLRK